MGAADLVPGVSGGTIALITGIYKELLESINSFSWNTLKNIKKEGLTDVWKKLNGFFLLTVFGGIITSILLFSQILEWFIINEPIGLWSFFFGLLIASIIYLIKTDISFTGLVERMNMSLLMLKQLFPTYLEGLSQLETIPRERTFHVSRRETVYSAEAQAVLDEICRFDNQLYEFASELLSERVKTCTTISMETNE